MRFAFLVAALLFVPLSSGSFHETPAKVPDRIVVLTMSGHSFNGMAWPETPLLEAFLGERVHFAVHVPAFAEPHTFHLHGHPWPLSDGRVVDTFLLRAGETHRFEVIAGGADHEAGDWMYHCHIDDHVAQGMWGVFRVYPFATRLIGPAGPAFTVQLDRLGEPLDDAGLEVTLDGAPVATHVVAQGQGRYLVHAPALEGASGALVVTATAAPGVSLARATLGEAPVLVPVGGGPGAVHGHGA